MPEEIKKSIPHLLEITSPREDGDEVPLLKQNFDVVGLMTLRSGIPVPEED